MRKVTIALSLIALASGVAVAEIDTSLIPSQDAEVPFRLFPTSNIWTFLMLNTMDGRIWQLQYDVQGKNRGTVILSDNVLADEEEQFPGRFTLYPTSNMYTFILLDQYYGRTWQMQWAEETELRGIIPIY